MSGFIVRTNDNIIIRFSYYQEDAPVTCKAFNSLLPFARIMVHARVSGQEIWTNDPTRLDIIQENASVFTEPGEVVLGPLKPARTKTASFIGIYYGEGKGVDCANIFARVVPGDMELLQKLGNAIWRNGEQVLTFDVL